VEERLLPINTLLSLLLPNDVTPPALADAGFRLAGLEIPAASAAGAVTIDCLLFHADTNHLVLVEAKSGPNIEEEQAMKYGRLQASAVVQSAYVTLSVRTQPTVETVYLCLEEHLERVRLGLASAGLTYPIIAVSDSRVALDGAGAASAQVKAVFASGPIALLGRPARLISFDQDSDIEVIKPRVLAVLVAAMSQRLAQLTLVSLAERATPHFGLYGRQAQQKIKKKVAEAARQIAEDEPANFQYMPTTGSREGLVRILRTPEDNDARGRTQAYQAVGRPAKLRRPRKAAEVAANQMDLLAELDTIDNETSEGRPADGGEGEQ
jgi:hypothetical protein